MPIEPTALPLTTTIPHLVEVNVVAHRLSVSPEYVRDLIRDGKLAGVRLGNRWRVDTRDVTAFIDAQRVTNGHGHYGRDS